jgi:peptide/nickel transport system substrate-binding protein
VRFALAAILALAAAAASPEPLHGIAMHGDPALPADFDHLPYANPDAPKGGRITYGFVGTFDSLNPFIVKGTSPRGLWDEAIGRNLWESLLIRNRDEPFSLYGLLAETVEVPPDRSWVEFTLRPEAKWADGEPVTPDDVIFTYNLLKEKFRQPTTRKILSDSVTSVEKTGERSVRYTFKDGSNRELPMIIGLLVVLPKHAVDPATFEQTSFTALVGSGAYAVSAVDAGKSVILKRRDDYWGKDLPIKRGFDNFDEIRIEYYRNDDTYFEAFKKGLFDANRESDPTRWATQYNFPAVTEGRIVKVNFPSRAPKPMTGFVFNTERPIFADRRVREALTYCIDFEWMNRSLYYGLYKRVGSYFQDSDLSALAVPASDAEKALLAKFPDAVTPAVMDGTYAPPVSDGSGTDRAVLRKAFDLLKAAGYERKGNSLVNSTTNAPLSFEVLVRTAEDENLALAMQRTCSLLGVKINVRRLEPLQFEVRIKDFDYDMIRFVYLSSLSPGNEQNNRWASASAHSPGSFNFAGVKDPAVDAMIGALLSATGQDDFVTAVRAYDRVLMSGTYLVPLFYAPEDWWALSSRIKHPEKPSLYGAEPTTWWVEQ